MENEKAKDGRVGSRVLFYAPGEAGEEPAKRPKPCEFVAADFVVRATGTYTPPPDRG